MSREGKKEKVKEEANEDEQIEVKIQDFGYHDSFSNEFEYMEIERTQTKQTPKETAEINRIREEPRKKQKIDCKVHIFHTLDDDWEESQRRKSTKVPLESDKESEDKKQESEVTEAEDKSDQSTKKSNTKARGGGTAGSTRRELRNLLSDAKTTKKWGLNIQYEGQAELYEQLDKVLTKLKDFTEHSYPFLSRVRKADAPDYYEIIKHPMDLGLMTKKLNKGEYYSKAEFVADIQLIFSNCRLYNTDPSSKIYLQHADAMEKKAKELLKNVKPIDFSEQRAAALAAEQSNNQQSETPTTSSTKGKKKKSVKKDEMETTEVENEKDKAPISTPLSKAEKKKEVESLPSEETEESESYSMVITKDERIKWLEYREQQNGLPFAERSAFIRTPVSMSSYIDASDVHEEECNKTSHKSFHPEITHFMGILPDLYQPVPSTERRTVSDKSIFESSIAQSDRVRAAVDTRRAQIHEVKFDSPLCLLPADVAFALFRKSIGLLLSHSGFEGVEKNALDMITDVVGEHMMQFMKLLKLNQEDHGAAYPLEEILDESLRESGEYEGIKDLAEFVKRGFVPETTTTEAPQNTIMYPPLLNIQPQPQPQPQPQLQPQPQVEQVESEIKDEYSDAALQRHLQEVETNTYQELANSLAAATPSMNNGVLQRPAERKMSTPLNRPKASPIIRGTPTGQQPTQMIPQQPAEMAADEGYGTRLSSTKAKAERRLKNAQDDEEFRLKKRPKPSDPRKKQKRRV